MRPRIYDKAGCHLRFTNGARKIPPLLRLVLVNVAWKQLAVGLNPVTPQAAHQVVGDNTKVPDASLG